MTKGLYGPVTIPSRQSVQGVSIFVGEGESFALWTGTKLFHGPSPILYIKENVVSEPPEDHGSNLLSVYCYHPFFNNE